MRPGSSRTRTFPEPKSSPENSPWEWLRQRYLLAALLIALLVALLAEMPWLSSRVRSLLVPIDLAALLTVLAASGFEGDDLRTIARRGPTPLLLALLAWCVLSAALSPYRAFAVPELFRLFLCAAVYLTAAYGLTSREAPLAAYGVLVLGGAVALYGAIEFGASPSEGFIQSIFGNHEQFGSFLVLLLPVALAFALDRDTEPKISVGALAITLIVGAALLLARTRSAWAGGAISLLTLSLLTLRYAPLRLNASNKMLIVGPLVIVVLSFALLIGVSELAPLLSARAVTLNHVMDDGSFADRLHRWRAACRMASEKPVTGWGLGVFPVIQGRWTHQGDDVSVVLSHGTGHSNLAHNFWAQWTAETGGVGLALYVSVMVAFFGVGLGALRTLASGARRTLLMGCLAAVAGGAADAVGAPSYTFPGVSSLFWLWIGLGIAACRAGNHRPQDNAAPALPPTPPRLWAGSLEAGALAALIVLGCGWLLRAEGQNIPRGRLIITSTPPGPVAPGALVLWAAAYLAPDGTPRATLPGAVWAVTEGRLDKTRPAFTFSNRRIQESGLLGVVPSQGTHSPSQGSPAAQSVRQVTVTARYWDNFSRPYVASRTLLIREQPARLPTLPPSHPPSPPVQNGKGKR